MTQVSKLSSTNYLIWQLILYDVLNMLKTLVNYNATWNYDNLNDQDMIINCYAHVWKISLPYRNGP